MSLASSPPAEVLMVIFEHLFVTKDLLCAALVNRAWRKACVGLNKLWRRHWQFIKLSATECRRTLAKNPDEVDWYAETSAGLLRDAAWKSGKFTHRFLTLPAGFWKLNCVDGDIALITTRRPPKEGESTGRWGRDIDVFSLVDKNTFEVISTFPRLPGEFHDVAHVEGLGPVFNITEYPRNYYYITEDAYKWLGNPTKTSAGKLKWPKLDGFVFLGSQTIQSEGGVYLHVDGAYSQTPQLSIHEQDTDNLNWVRWAPWKGPGRRTETWNEDFLDHTVTDDHVIITSHRASIVVRQRKGNKMITLVALKSLCARYSFSSSSQSAQDLSIEDFIDGLKNFKPAVSTATAAKTEAAASDIKKLLESENYTYCSNVTPAGKHLFCIVGDGLIVFRDFAGPFAGRPKLPPFFVDMGGAALKFKACGDRLVLHEPSAFYIIDSTQFDNAALPDQLVAVKITRFGVIDSGPYGHRTDSKEKGATAQVVVSPGAIREVLKIDHSWWKEDDEKVKQPASNKCEQIDHFVRIYDFE